MAFSKKLENRTLEAMISIYCRHAHNTRNQLCSDCEKLQDYARQRIDRCIFGEEKPVCSKCPVHCYKSDMREAIKQVMQYSGPRMLYTSPLLSLRYFYRKLLKGKNLNLKP